MRFFLLLLIPLTAFAKYEATNTVQIHPAFIGINPVGQKGQGLTPNFIENEIESIVAPATLRAALSLLHPENPEDKPFSDEAVGKLAKNVFAKPIRGTDLIQISAQAETKEEALKLTNAVTEAYITRRKEAEINRAKRALKALDDELVPYSELVADCRKELTFLIQENGIPYFEDGQANPLGLTEEQMRVNARRKLDEFEIMRDQIELQIKKLAALKDDQLALYAASLDLPGNELTDHYLEYQKLRTDKLALFDQGLKPADPKVIAITLQIKKQGAQIQKQVAKLKGTLNTKLNLINRRLREMKELVQNKENAAIRLALIQRQYSQSKEAYEQSRAMLCEMKIRQQEARVLLKMPRDPVTIHEKAR